MHFNVPSLRPIKHNFLCCLKGKLFLLSADTQHSSGFLYTNRFCVWTKMFHHSRKNENKTNLSFETKEKKEKRANVLTFFPQNSVENVNNLKFIDFAVISRKMSEMWCISRFYFRSKFRAALSVPDLNSVEWKFERNKRSLSCQRSRDKVLRRSENGFCGFLWRFIGDAIGLIDFRECSDTKLNRKFMIRISTWIKVWLDTNLIDMLWSQNSSRSYSENNTFATIDKLSHPNNDFETC